MKDKRTVFLLHLTSVGGMLPVSSREGTQHHASWHLILLVKIHASLSRPKRLRVCQHIIEVSRGETGLTVLLFFERVWFTGIPSVFGNQLLPSAKRTFRYHPIK